MPDSKDDPWKVLSVTTSSSISNSTFSTSGTIGYVPMSGQANRIDAAVYAYLQAQRALGRTGMKVDEVAAALNLPREEVKAAARRMADMGVKLKS